MSCHSKTTTLLLLLLMTRRSHLAGRCAMMLFTPQVMMRRTSEIIPTGVVRWPSCLRRMIMAMVMWQTVYWSMFGAMFTFGIVTSTTKVRWMMHSVCQRTVMKMRFDLMRSRHMATGSWLCGRMLLRICSWKMASIPLMMHARMRW